MKNFIRVASLAATLICSLHPTLALATVWKLGAGVEVETQNIPVSGLAGVSADGDRRAAGTNMQTAAAGLNQIGNENQQKLDDASREISKKWTESKSMPEGTPEEKQAKQKRMDELNEAEKELERVREWNQETALNRAREMNMKGQELISSAQDSGGGEAAGAAQTGNEAAKTPFQKYKETGEFESGGQKFKVDPAKTETYSKMWNEGTNGVKGQLTAPQMESVGMQAVGPKGEAVPYSGIQSSKGVAGHTWGTGEAAYTYVGETAVSNNAAAAAPAVGNTSAPATASETPRTYNSSAPSENASPSEESAEVVDLGKSCQQCAKGSTSCPLGYTCDQ